MSHSGALGYPTRSDLVVFSEGRTPAERSIEKRRVRKHHVLNAVREHGPLSRTDISRRTGFNIPAVSSLVEELLADGLVREDPAIALRRGRHPVPVVLNEGAAAILAMDVGWMSTTALLLRLDGTVIRRKETSTPDKVRERGLIPWIEKSAASLLLDGGQNLPPLCGVGIGIPGLIGHTGRDALGVTPSVRDSLERFFGVSVLMDNDARMMAFGSLWFGHGRRHDSFVVVNLGHGLGMGIVQEGRVLRGSRGFCGELGHVPLGEPGVSCYCGASGCLENIASGSGLIRMARKRGLAESVEELADRARSGSQAEAELFEEFANRLGAGLATVVNLLDPEAIVLSGRVTRAADVFLPSLERHLRAEALRPLVENTPIHLSEHTTDLGALGAAGAVMQHIFANAHVSLNSVI